MKLMSNYDYRISFQIEGCGYPFYAIIMAAMRQADTDNLAKLRLMFPEVWEELQRWHRTPGALDMYMEDRKEEEDGLSTE